MVKFASRPHHAKEKSHLYPLDKRLGGTQSRSGGGDEKKKILVLPGIESLARREHDCVTKECPGNCTFQISTADQRGGAVHVGYLSVGHRHRGFEPYRGK